MYILAIETSCDETAAAVVENGRRVLSNVVSSQVDTHKIYGGVVPEIASRIHSEVISDITARAIEESGIALWDIDAVAVTYAPGLIGALLVGVNFAKGLSLSLGKPLIAVHHLRGHIASNYITYKDLEPPFLSLVVSGGHSHIVHVQDYTRMTVIAKTRDDAAGEAFDKAARALGLPYPGGVHIDRAAQGGNDSAYPLPRPRVDGAPLDFSFSGLKTAVLNTLHNAEQRNEKIDTANMAASFRRAVVNLLTENFLEAAGQNNIKSLAVAGGVGANSLLRDELIRLCDEKGYKLYLPKLCYCGDNAAMIAAQGYYEFLKGNTAGMNLNAESQRGIENG